MIVKTVYFVSLLQKMCPLLKYIVAHNSSIHASYPKISFNGGACFTGKSDSQRVHAKCKKKKGGGSFINCRVKYISVRSVKVAVWKDNIQRRGICVSQVQGSPHQIEIDKANARTCIPS